MARPISEKYQPERLIKIFEEYLEQAEIPILKEVCLQNNLSYKYIFELKEKHPDSPLTESISRITDKKEVVLEKGALTGKYNSTACIFSLKQLGWRDWKDEPKPMIEKVIIVNDLGDLDENR